MSYQGDYAEDYATLNFKFTSKAATGVPTALVGGVISIYKANDTTQSVAGVTLTADFDSIVGLNNVLIDLSADAFYAVANDYQIIITAGTVGGVSVVGDVVGTFSIENRATPTVTEIVNGVWNEPIAGHLTAGTTGLSEALGSAAITDTTITGTPTTTEIVLSAGSTVDNFYNDQTIYILGGTGIAQVKTILSYDGATKTVTTDEDWVIIPASGDRIAILIDHIHPVTQIQAGLATSAEVAALNDFDPAVDVVANVALVDVTTLNTDMLTTTAILASGDIDGWSLEETFRVVAAAVAGVGSGAQTITMTYKGVNDSAKSRIVATTDLIGNRSAVAYDVTT